MKDWLFKQLYDHPNGVNWASLLYQHGNIDLLIRSADKPTNVINSKLFAETLIEVVGNTQIVKMHKALDESNTEFKSSLLKNFKHATNILYPSDMVHMFQSALQSAESYSKTDVNSNEAQIYSRLVSQIQDWYTDLEERLAYWYKKKTRVRLFYLGTILALIINVDSIELFQYFNNSSASREAIIAYYQTNHNALNESLQYSSETAKQEHLVFEMESLIQELKLPVGWDYNMFSKSPTLCDPYFYILKILGILISGFAASFGAPFWFELFKKINPSSINISKS